MTKLFSRDGDWFAVPLRDGGFALGVVARAAPSGVLLGYFFGPRRDEMPTLDDAVGLRTSDAVLIARFGHLGLTQRTWTTLGSLGEWERKEWPMPAFCRYEELTGRTYRVHYADDDPNDLQGEELIPPGTAEQLPKDAMLGAGAVEKVLTRLLSST